MQPGSENAAAIVANRRPPPSLPWRHTTPNTFFRPRRVTCSISLANELHMGTLAYLMNVHWTKRRQRNSRHCFRRSSALNDGAA
jgi:hypothetical protein